MPTSVRPKITALFRVFSGTILVICIKVTSATAAGNDPRDEARALGYDGIHAYYDGDYKTAVDKLHQAFETLEVPTLGLWLARSLEQSGRWIEALEQYERVVKLPIDPDTKVSVQEEAIAEAREEQREMVNRIPRIKLLVEESEVSVVRIEINGHTVDSSYWEEGVPCDPGETRVVAFRGAERIEQRVELGAGDRVPVNIRFPSVPSSFTTSAVLPTVGFTPAPLALDSDPTPAREPMPQSSIARLSQQPSDASPRPVWLEPLAWGSIGAGTIAFGAGAVVGVIAAQKIGEFKADCTGRQCPSSVEFEVKRYNAMRTTSSFGLIAGSVLAVGGVALLYLPLPPFRSTSAQRPAVVTPYLSLDRVGLSGAF